MPIPLAQGLVPHGWVSHILCCARTGAEGPVVLTVTRMTCAASKAMVTGSVGHSGYTFGY